MATQYFKRNLLLNVYREGKEISLVCFLLPLKGDKMSDTCRLFPPFGDRWPSCLLHSQHVGDSAVGVARKTEIDGFEIHLEGSFIRTR